MTKVQDHTLGVTEHAVALFSALATVKPNKLTQNRAYGTTFFHVNSHLFEEDTCNKLLLPDK